VTTPTRPAFKEVPPAHTDERDVRDTRTRQATFERGVALALVTGMVGDLKHLRTLTEGLRWVVSSEEMAEVQRWLEVLHEDILRTERMGARYDQK
jgi:hypothetical protein